MTFSALRGGLAVVREKNEQAVGQTVALHDNDGNVTGERDVKVGAHDCLGTPWKQWSSLQAWSLGRCERGLQASRSIWPARSHAGRADRGPLPRGDAARWKDAVEPTVSCWIDRLGFR